MDIKISTDVALAQRGYSKKWLAEKLGISQTQVSRLLAEDANLTSKSLRRLAEAFGLTVGQFIALGETSPSGSQERTGGDI